MTDWFTTTLLVHMCAYTYIHTHTHFPLEDIMLLILKRLSAWLFFSLLYVASDCRSCCFSNTSLQFYITVVAVSSLTISHMKNLKSTLVAVHVKTTKAQIHMKMVFNIIEITVMIFWSDL